ncbi:MAG: class I SAM-dependent methyltransferase [bacterium]|nr:class I SAM-dependent methyltransferase [bacterium]
MTIAKQAYRHYEPAGKEAGLLPLVEHMRVLEIGFGTGLLLDALRKRGNDVYGIDVGEDIVAKAQARGLENVLLLDVSEEPLPFEDDFFDAIYCYEVLEHLTNPHRLFTEIRRTLKWDCCLYFSVPAQEIDMGYGELRHPFVYPGLLERPNLERFFMQMYFRIESMVETGRLLEGRSYVLRNRKDPAKPDIVEVVTRANNLADLYGDVLSKDKLAKELTRETDAHLMLMLAHGQQGEWEGVYGICEYLMREFPTFLPMYIRMAEVFQSLGKREQAEGILTLLIDHPNVPVSLSKQAQTMLRPPP